MRFIHLIFLVQNASGVWSSKINFRSIFGHPIVNKLETYEFHDQIIIQIAELDYQLGLS